MTTLIKKYDKFYNKLGHHGIMALLYVIFLAAHLILSFTMYLPSIDPNELSIAAIGAYFSGSDWSAVMTKSEYYYGFVQGIIYTPIMLITKDPFLQYKLMLAINSVIISFIPVIAYSCARKMGVYKPWLLSAIGVCIGFSAAYIAHTKFIWCETSAIIFPWIIILLIINTARTKGRIRKHLMSALTATAAVFAYAAHARLIAVVIAALVMIFFARLGYKKKLVNLSSFLPTFVIFMILERLMAQFMQQNLWQQNEPALMINTLENFIVGLPAELNGNGIMHFLQTLVGQLYYFCASTWGLGGIGLCIICFIAAAFFRSRKAYKKGLRTAIGDNKKESLSEIKQEVAISENNSRKSKLSFKMSQIRNNDKKTKTSEKINNENIDNTITGLFTTAPPSETGVSMVEFALFAGISLVLMLIIGALYRFSNDSFFSYQDSAIFGRYLDGISPFIIMIVMIFIFHCGISLKHMLISTITLSAIYVTFLLVTEPITVAAESARISPVLGIYPLLFGENIGSLLDHMSILTTISVSFCVAALFIVITCCAKKLKVMLLTAIVVIISIYTCVYTCICYLPLSVAESQNRNAPLLEVSEYIYNQKDAPPVTLYRTNRHSSIMLQFLNQEIVLKSTNNQDEIEENTFIVKPIQEALHFSTDPQTGVRIPLALIAQTEQYSIYAYGERAIAYAQSQG